MGINTLLYPKIYIGSVLILSWAYTAFLFSKPERSRFFPYIMFIPAVVAIIVSYIQHRSLTHLLKPIIAPIDIKTLSFSILYPLVFIICCAIVAHFTGLAKFLPDKLKSLTEFPSLPMVAMGMLAMFGEEYGWRGYLLPELTQIKGPIYATLVVGVVWALWHGPLLFGLAKVMNTGSPILVSTTQMLAVIVFSFPFAYAFYKTGSIIPPMLFHYIWNMYNPKILGNIYQNRTGIMDGNILLINGEGVLGVLLGSLFVIWFLYTINVKGLFGTL